MSAATFWDGREGATKYLAMMRERAGVVRDLCLQRPSPVQIAHTTDAMCRDAIRQLDGDDIDAIVQVGTNLSMVRFAAAAEYFLDKPVIAINTATYWHALRAVGIGDKSQGFGNVMSQH